jgi:NADH-quinone oxidoreductase subunit N
MFSMTGIPLTAGFAGKFLMFSSAFGQFNWLVGIALLGSAISIAYYFRIFKDALFKPSGETANYSIGWAEYAGLVIATLITLSVGIWPALITGIQTIAAK